METPDYETIVRGVNSYRSHEKRDAIYNTATFLVDHNWGDPSNVANGVGVLLSIWNQAFYRQVNFAIDLDALERVIRDKESLLADYRRRDILSLEDADYNSVEMLFDELSVALGCDYVAKNGARVVRTSSISTAKSLHILAPRFFPLWDSYIAVAYGFAHRIDASSTYFQFMKIMQQFVREMDGRFPGEKKSMLKLIDEYNYARYTKHWI